MIALAVGAFIIVGVGVFLFHPDSPLRDPGLTETVDAAQAQAPNFTVGVCVDQPSGPSVVPCQQPHKGEVYAILQVDTKDGDRPTGNRLQDFAAERCRPHYEGYVGSSLTDTALFTTAEPSTDDQWKIGAKYILCLVVNDRSFSPSTGSVRGSGR